MISMDERQNETLVRLKRLLCDKEILFTLVGELPVENTDYRDLHATWTLLSIPTILR